jgi:integrase
MSVKKRGKKWWIDVTVWKGKIKHRTRRPAGKHVTNKAQALSEEAAERARLEGLTGNALKPPFFSNFADEFQDSYAKANNKPSELASKKMILDRHLKPAFGHLRLDEVTTEAIEKYKAAKLAGSEATADTKAVPPLKPKSINNHLTCLATVLAIAVEWGRLSRPPKIRKLKPADTPAPFLTFEQAAALLRYGAPIAGQPWGVMILTGLRAGLRISEMLALRWVDLDFSAKTINVRQNVWKGIVGTPKGGKADAVPMCDELHAALRELQQRGELGPLVFCPPNGEPWTRDDTTRPIRRACRAAGLKAVGWHVLRHTFASHLVMRGVHLKAVQQLMRHASIVSTMRYAHLAPQTTRDAVELLTPKRDQ